MRYKLFASLVLSFAFITAHAAAPKYKYNRRGKNKLDAIKFGVTLGPSGATVLEDELEPSLIGGYQVQLRNEPLSTYSGGAFGAYKLTNKIDFQFLLLYTRKGNKSIQISKPLLDPNLPTERIETTLNLDYLQATTLINIFPGKDRQFFFSVGGHAGYLAIAKQYKVLYENGIRQDQDRETINLKEEGVENKPENFDLGLVLGLGYEFKIGLILDLRNDVGLKTIFKDKKDKNLLTHISLGYNFANLLK